MTKSWLPWVFPAALILAVIAAAISTAAIAIVLLALCCVGLPVLRLRYLKAHPPDPELVHKPFWRF